MTGPIDSHPFVETIRWSDGRYHLTGLHAERMRTTIREVYPDATLPTLDLPLPPEDLRGLTLKCRLLYRRQIEALEFHPYTPRPVESLRLVIDDSIDYHLKSTDRAHLNRLEALRGDCDGIIIVKNGMLTDTGYTNLLFQSEEGRLYTPATPLLKGVMRHHLLQSNHPASTPPTDLLPDPQTPAVTPYPLTPADLLPGNPLRLTAAILINAMLPPGTLPPIPITRITQ